MTKKAKIATYMCIVSIVAIAVIIVESLIYIWIELTPKTYFINFINKDIEKFEKNNRSDIWVYHTDYSGIPSDIFNKKNIHITGYIDVLFSKGQSATNVKYSFNNKIHLTGPTPGNSIGEIFVHSDNKGEGESDIQFQIGVGQNDKFPDGKFILLSFGIKTEKGGHDILSPTFPTILYSFNFTIIF